MTARQRIVAGTVAQLSWQAVDQDGEPSDPGTTTVEVLASDGSTVLAAGTATTASGDLRTVSIPAQEVDQLTATWTGASAVGETTVDVVGGVYFTSAEMRAKHPTVAAGADYSLAELIEARTITETLFEQRLRTAFVPRFEVLTTDSQCRASRTGIREVRWVESLDGTVTTLAATVATMVEIIRAGVYCTPVVHRVGVVYGPDRPPADVIAVAMLYTRHLLTGSASGIDMRVLATSTPDGQVTRYATPGMGRWITGIPEIDEVLIAYRAPVPPRSVRMGGYR